MADKKGTPPSTTPPTSAPVTPKAKPRVLQAKVYMVLDEKAKKTTPVKSKTKSRAIAYCAAATFKAKLATMDELLELGRTQAEIHDATTEDE